MDVAKLEKIAHLATSGGVIVAIIALGFSIRDQAEANERAIVHEERLGKVVELQESAFQGLASQSRTNNALRIIVEFLTENGNQKQPIEIWEHLQKDHPSIKRFDFQQAIRIGIAQGYIFNTGKPMPYAETTNGIPNIALSKSIRIK